MANATRRGFLQFLGGLSLAPFVFSRLPERQIQRVVQDTQPKPAIDPGEIRWSGDRGYRYWTFTNKTRTGDVVVDNEGTPIGVAMTNAAASQFGWVQFHGPATIRSTT